MQDIVDKFNTFAEKIRLFYFITGSCAMRLHGIDRSPKDIDIIVCNSTDAQRKMIARWAKTQGFVKSKPAREGDLYCYMLGLNLDFFFHTDDEIASPGCVVWIGGLPLSSLERMLVEKQVSVENSKNPEKHREDLRLIRAFMETKRAT